MTARHRRLALGQRILAYDPFGIVAWYRQTAAYNPIDLVDATRPTTPDDVDDKTNPNVAECLDRNP